METSFKFITNFILVLFVIFTFRNLIDYLMDSTDNVKNDSTSWPTPFFSYVPRDYRSSAFFVYIFSSHFLCCIIMCMEGLYTIGTFYLSTKKLLVYFETMHMLLENLANDFPDYELGYSLHHSSEMQHNQLQEAKLRKNIALIVVHHQKINRSSKICANNLASSITLINFAIVTESCSCVFLLLQTDDQRKAILYILSFVTLNATNLFAYHNGQLIFNQNDILRKHLTQVPWINKPHWFKTSLHIMMTRANVDIEFKPHGIYVLNYMSFKDLIKAAFSFGNVLYSKKLASQSHK